MMILAVFLWVACYLMQGRPLSEPEMYARAGRVLGKAYV